MCLWGPTALGNSYWLLIVWQQPTCSGPPLTSKPSSGGVCVVASNALVSLGGHATYPCCPLYPPYTPHLATTTTTPPWTPHSITELAKDRGLFPSCHGDVAREKCKGREGKSGRGGGACAAKCAWAGMSENESGEGERQGEREKGGKGRGICADTTPGGDLCQCCNRVPARLSSRDCGKDCQCVNTCKNKRRVFNSSCSIWNLPEVFSLDKTGGWRAWRFSFLINQHLQLSGCISATLTAARVKSMSMMSLDPVYPWPDSADTRERKWKRVVFMGEY